MTAPDAPTPPQPEHVEVTEGGRLLASADVVAAPDPTSAVAALHVESGQLPAGTRTRLVDAVLDTPPVAAAQRLTTASPVGDVEVTDRLRERLDDVESRVAGSTTITDGHLRHP